MNDRGFTLLELLLSITMLVLITLILGGALHMAHSGLLRGEKKVHQLERLKTSYLLMGSQIQSLLPFYTDQEKQKKIYFTGSTDKLMIFSNYSLWQNTKGNVLVTYEILPNERGKQSLKVTEQTPFQDTKDEATLLDDCDGIGFNYFLKNGLEEGKWVDTWSDSEASLPDKIRVTMTCGGKTISYLYNVLTKPSEVTLSTLTSFNK